MRAVEWNKSEGSLLLIDQTLLPDKHVVVSCSTVDQVVDAIQRLVVRGAPALGAVGAYGVAVAMIQAQRSGWSADQLVEQVRRVRDARPTAVNLAWGPIA